MNHHRRLRSQVRHWLRIVLILSIILLDRVVVNALV